jgi:hypothetical protein
VAINPEENKNALSFACALGPRLLLNGRLYLHQKGVYFESFFNKKNFLFGRTRMFIQRKEITSVNSNNAFGFIPDVVEVETSRGSLYFHAYGRRDELTRSLIEYYFPESMDKD